MSDSASGWIIGQHVQVIRAGGNVAPYTVTRTTPIAIRWDGARWASAAIPQPDQTQSEMTLNRVVATSSSNVWIAGAPNGTTYTAGSPYASDNSYLIHFDGARWSPVPLPQIAAINPNHDISAVNQVSFDLAAPTPSDDLWIAGGLTIGANTSSQYVPLIYHYTGGQWVNVPLPAIKSTGGTPSSGSQPAG